MGGGCIRSFEGLSSEWPDAKAQSHRYKDRSVLPFFLVGGPEQAQLTRSARFPFTNENDIPHLKLDDSEAQ